MKDGPISGEAAFVEISVLSCPVTKAVCSCQNYKVRSTFGAKGGLISEPQASTPPSRTWCAKTPYYIIYISKNLLII